jgi:hypothetical protein
MSEYQYHEWQAVDRVLSPEEQTAVNDLSSHIEVSSSRAVAARKKHIAEMKALAAREAQVWQQVERILDTGRKIASVYDEATALLEKLYQLAEFQNTRDSFKMRFYHLTQKYGSRPSLIDRWKKRGWV